MCKFNLLNVVWGEASFSGNRRSGVNARDGDNYKKPGDEAHHPLYDTRCLRSRVALRT